MGEAPVLAHLRALSAGVIVGTRCLSPERAAAIRALADAGVPVSAWLLLPREEGYFATYENLTQVEARVDAFLAWTAQHRLPLSRLGFDFEPDLRELEVFFARPARALARWARRSTDHERRTRALRGYGALLDRVRGAGFKVEAYQFPLLVEDRLAGSDFLQRLIGALDVPVEQEVLMAYSSLLGPLGAGLVEAWTRTARAVAVGSTGGGVDPLPPLSFAALARDLRLAARACPDVRIFSLEGCVQHDYLSRLRDLDWEAPVHLPLVQRAGAQVARTSARALARLLR